MSSKALRATSFQQSAVVLSPLDELLAMLTYRRPNGSKGERQFIARFLRPLPGIVEDAFGNLILDLTNGGTSRILWSAHTDTVHWQSGRQAVVCDAAGIIKLVAGETSNCLGGDNAVGCWLLRQMALAKVPGLYVWHRAEESGCQGSNWILKNRPDLLHGIDFAVAFDRRGVDSVVTHQISGRSCSDAFARQFAALLDLGHRPDPDGIYTDTATYADDVPECTNVSAGTAGEHTVFETVDSGFALRVLASVLAADFSQLQAERDPTVEDDEPWWQREPLRGGRKSLAWEDDDWRGSQWDPSDDGRGSTRRTTMANLVADHPREVAALLDDMGVSLAELEEFLGLAVYNS